MLVFCELCYNAFYSFILVAIVLIFAPNFPGSSLSNLPKDSDLFLAKKNEAYRKYEM